MIYVTGDTHGEVGRLYELDRVLKDGEYCIICGDFGYIFRDDVVERRLLDDIEARPYTLLFVDGNHENFPAIYRYPKELWNGGKIHRIRKNVIHLCRGQVFEIDGKSFFAFGGAYSIDKYMRREGISWWKEEMPTEEDYKEADKNLDAHDRKIDYIITHTAPGDTMNIYYPMHLDEKPLNNFLEYVRESVEYKHWYMGHLHKDEDIWRNQTLLWYDMVKIG